MNEDIRARSQAKYDQYYKELARLDADGLEGRKAFLTLNAGGCVSMLGLMQALITKGVAFTDFKPYGMVSLTLFAAGLVFSALIPVASMLNARNTVRHLTKRGTAHDHWGHVTFVVWVLAGCTFFAGLLSVGVGISKLELEEPQAIGAPINVKSPEKSSPLVMRPAPLPEHLTR